MLYFWSLHISISTPRKRPLVLFSYILPHHKIKKNKKNRMAWILAWILNWET